MNLLLEALRSGERELRELENTSSRYWNAVEERRMLEAKLRNDEEELGLLVKRMAHLELLEKARGAWGEYDLSRKELADFQGPADFPERGGERMADLVAAIADLEAGLREDEAKPKPRKSAAQKNAEGGRAYAKKPSRRKPPAR